MECAQVSGSPKQCGKGLFHILIGLCTVPALHINYQVNFNHACRPAERFSPWSRGQRHHLNVVPPPPKAKATKSTVTALLWGRGVVPADGEPALQPVRICVCWTRRQYFLCSRCCWSIGRRTLAVAEMLQDPAARCHGTWCFSGSFSRGTDGGRSHTPHCLLKKNKLFPLRKSWSKKLIVHNVFFLIGFQLKYAKWLGSSDTGL